MGPNCHVSPYNWCFKMEMWQMVNDIPWCATCHHPNVRNFNIEINPMNF